MTSKKLFFGFVGLLIVLGVGIFLSAHIASGLLAKRSAKLTSLKATNQALVKQQAQIAKDKQDIAKYSSLNQIAKSVVPQDKNQAEAVREIVNLAGQSGINLSSITFPQSNLGTAPTKTANGLTQVTKVKGIGGVDDLQITITQANSNTVPYANFLNFLTRLEQNRRTAEVSSIKIQPDKKKSSNVSFTLIIDEFIKP
ncbi:MAG: hypothetical protein ACREGA_03245 [Candidatus Saccharimonadales bacterium]